LQGLAVVWKESTKMRNRDQREAKALQLLRRWPDASALDIGIAAVNGEPRAFAIPRKAKTAIGLSIAVELVRRKLAKPTKDNRFAVAGTGDGASGF
jgi:hypothetical protein